VLVKKTSQKYTARAKKDTKLYVLNQMVFQALENEYVETEKHCPEFLKGSSKRRAVYQTSSTVRDVSCLFTQLFFLFSKLFFQFLLMQSFNAFHTNSCIL
jgi:hypothetical protein